MGGRNIAVSVDDLQSFNQPLLVSVLHAQRHDVARRRPQGSN
jgi:hypothetical protein